MELKSFFNAVTAAMGCIISFLFGGIDKGIAVLLVFMLLDFICGIIVAGVFGASNKTESGALESRAGWKGLCRKFGTLAVVLIACLLDSLMGSDYIRDAVVICYLCNEVLSIIENLALMGVPVPDKIKNALDVLKNKNNNK
ncbi:MAG: phage holin family protein [Clostridiales bacterium]|nr:phage holin family protein [Clostridiales bacterium]